MTSYLFSPSGALLEILVSQQVPGERGHRLNVASGDFVQILKLLQDKAAGLHLDASAAAFNQRPRLITRVDNRVGGEDVLLHY